MLITKLLAAALAYALVGWVDHQFLAELPWVDLWRPATGLALAMLLLGGLRMGWAVLAGALVVTLLTHGLSLDSVALGLGGVVGPWLGAWLLRKQANFDPHLGRFRDYRQLVVWGGALGSAAAALVGVGALWLLGAVAGNAAPDLVLRWWMGDVLGVLVVAPLLLVWWGAKPMWRSREHMVEALCAMAASGLVGQMVFLDWFTDAQHRSPQGYWMFLFVGWAALRLGRRSVAFIVFTMALQAIAGALLGRGFFADDLATTQLAGFWRYTMALSLAGMALAYYEINSRNAARTLRDRALNKVQEGVSIGNPQRQLVYVNDAYVRITGYSREELLGQPCGKLLHGKATHPDTVQRIQAAIDARLPFYGEILNYRKDGTPFWNDLSITPIFDEYGDVQEFFAVQRDITSQKEAELELHKSKETLDLVLKSSNDGIWDWNVMDDTIERSLSWCQILGHTTQGLAANRAAWLALMHPDDLERASQQMNSFLAGEQDRYSMELRMRHKDGHYVSVLTRGYIVRDAQGRAVRVCGTTSDLTAQKEADAKLSLSAAVFQQSREGITMTDAQRNIIMVNKAFTDITGYTEAEVLGKNPRLLTSGRHNRDFYRAMWGAIGTQGHWEGEIWNRRKDGTIYPEWLAVAAMRNEKNEVTHYIGSFSDLSDAKAAEGRIQHLSHFDTLTGLPNRALLKDRTEHGISMAQRAGEPLTMMLVGIDHLRSVNDSLGHHIGDGLLVEMAQRLSDAVREQDTVARLGGKEFVLVLPETSGDGGAHLATELLWKLAQPFSLEGHELTLTATIGIASYPDNGSDFDTLLKSVEIAMHRAQSLGRDTFQFYNEAMHQQVVARDQMVKALRNAASLDQLHVAYQPQVDLQTGRIGGMEALLRWTHPELGVVPPIQFIPVAEESGLIKGLGEWVLRQACRDIRAWLDKGMQVPHVAVNVSPMQFHDDDLIVQVKQALADFRIDPSQLYLEVTESSLMDDVARSETMLKDLKDLGIKLALDDFGTGYSSLSYLKRFPFDKVKIDQSFVRDVTTNQSDNVIVQVIISMAHGLGLKVVAEGVETQAQCEIMRTSVCDEIQGYFFSKPINAQSMEALLNEGRQLPTELLRFRKPQRTLLLVDDEPNVLAALKRLFRRDGYTIITANSGPEGLEALAQHKVDVIMSDQRMPGMTGVQFLRAAKLSHPDTIRIVLSGFTELQSVTDAINEGAIYRFLTKPWDDAQLRDQISKAFEYRELQEENLQLDLKIRTANQELVAANRQLGEVVVSTRQQIEREEVSLLIAREALQFIPMPVIGIDDEEVIAFVNTAAEKLLSQYGPVLGDELAYALPAVAAALAETEEGGVSAISIAEERYLLQWNTMGNNSRSKGKLIMLTRTGQEP
ncbi:MAG: hypothetical protein A3F78_00440 [Burkholderiales bacterium RIFCSPLOWO2_12_FULL_61_40]|nr:MAG: hypothetical protein A3F78_00440 [Burkholderiales bacterium RIFCSPLOWO2_12_FULL_61_40]